MGETETHPYTRLELPCDFGYSMNLGIDEVLLEQAERSQIHSRVIRFWSPSSPAVILGRSSPASSEANLDHHRTGSFVLRRRCSGGQSIVAGPGCLMYAVLIDYLAYPQLRMIDQAHRFVMDRMHGAIKSLGIRVDHQGTSDLTLNGRKFSGNSLRCKKDAFVYHGTMICEDFDLSLVSKYLNRPIREPEYRAGRSHDDFLTQLPVDCETLKQAIVQQWNALEPLPTDAVEPIIEEARQLASDKYDSDAWTFKVP